MGAPSVVQSELVSVNSPPLVPPLAEPPLASPPPAALSPPLADPPELAPPAAAPPDAAPPAAAPPAAAPPELAPPAVAPPDEAPPEAAPPAPGAPPLSAPPLPPGTGLGSLEQPAKAQKNARVDAGIRRRRAARCVEVMDREVLSKRSMRDVWCYRLSLSICDRRIARRSHFERAGSGGVKFIPLRPNFRCVIGLCPSARARLSERTSRLSKHCARPVPRRGREPSLLRATRWCHPLLAATINAQPSPQRAQHQ